MRLMHASWFFFAQSKSGRHGYNIIRWTRPPFSSVFIKNKRNRPPFSSVFTKNKRNRPPFSSVFIKNKRTRPPFSFVFIKNKRNHPPFSSVFEKNRRSKGLEQLFSRKTNVPRGWNKHFWEKQTFQGVGTSIFEKNNVLPTDEAYIQPFFKVSYYPTPHFFITFAPTNPNTYKILWWLISIK